MVTFILMKEMLRPIPAALASCTRFFEAMSAMRESFSTLQKLRVGHSSLSMTPGGSSDDSKFLTPPQWREGSMLDSWKQVDETIPESDGLDAINQRRLSWPSSIKREQQAKVHPTDTPYVCVLYKQDSGVSFLLCGYCSAICKSSRWQVILTG